MELHQLRYFAKVAELGHFTRAAAACRVSQPSLSQQIIKLERELGRPLFERLGRSVRLTEAGRQFKERVDQILGLVSDARARVSDEPDAGRLVVAAIPTIAPYHLPRLLTEFKAECPGARIEVVEETTANILKLCNQGELDAAFLALPLKEPDLQVEPLFTEELLAVLPADHPLAAKRRLTLGDLAAEPFVLLNEAHCLTGNSLSFCANQSIAPVATTRMHQLATVQEMVRLGHGVSLVPAMAARNDADARRVYRSLSGDKPTRTVALAWNRLRYQTKLLKRFARLARRTAEK